MAELSELFPNAASIDSAAAAGGRMEFSAIPAKGAVYLLTAEGGGPVLLATVGDLRAALLRRLADTAADAKSKRVEYGRICTRVHYRVVYSPFAANYWYHVAAKALYAETSRALIPWRDSWWIGVEKEGDFPRFRKMTDVTDGKLVYAGPIRDKHAANRLVELMEDLFDLCRYHQILVQAPHGKACAYKEMGKCPAPCDGSVSLGHYRGQIEEALEFLGAEGREHWFAEMEARMTAAAGKREFEKAARMQQRLKRASVTREQPFRHVGRLEDFSFLALEPGQGRPYLEPFLIYRGRIVPREVIQKKTLDASVKAIFSHCKEAFVWRETDAGKGQGQDLPLSLSETLALVSHHLYRGEADPGRYLRLRDVVDGGVEFLEREMSAFLMRKSKEKPLPELGTDAGPVEPHNSQAEPTSQPDA